MISRLKLFNINLNTFQRNFSKGSNSILFNKNSDIFSNRSSRKQFKNRDESDFKKRKYLSCLSNLNLTPEEIEKNRLYKINSIGQQQTDTQLYREHINQFYLSHQDKFSDSSDPKNLHCHGKKSKLALYFAYIGTGYSGLEYLPSLKFQGLENVLEKAMFIAGHILPTNLGDLNRIKWERSSRTDKGVHSLCTVISAHVLLDDYKFSKDNNAIQFVSEINKHLPENLRLLSAYKIPRSFSARRNCNERTYHYLIPQKYLHVKDFDRMDEILSKFVGWNSFHNFTSHRKTYKDVRVPNNNSSTTNQNSVELEKENEIEDEEQVDEDEEVENEEVEVEETNSNNDNLKKRREIKVDRNLEKLSFRTNVKNIRNISSFSVNRKPMIIDGEEWIRFEVTGESFITYQIRKMMGYFLAVYKGYQSLEGLEIALKSPFSVRAPVAPPHTLHLYDTSFVDTKDGTQAYQIVGDINHLEQLKSTFCRDKLYPHLNEVDKQTNDNFDSFFNKYLPEHYYGLDDLKQIWPLYKEFLVEQDSRRSFRKLYFKNKK
ncbi:hypothetical protein DLAC_03399 [Tieghemostelium lacteum]|uniref:Pseudouridine synthase I TruA alpha/beta domain-containing protein n=1 Tax=Tieghemostelium lacteum TaxID=361077 RepID=A0A152A1Z8_TIELA|nr:hypothetical protein DLAC_03399 [Tieghemostelium lacteum]|eukprot:KYR00240.1 hypothetical protein DLAC_03399 [Tieghemostelium lacteum]